MSPRSLGRRRLWFVCPPPPKFRMSAVHHQVGRVSYFTALPCASPLPQYGPRALTVKVKNGCWFCGGESHRHGLPSFSRAVPPSRAKYGPRRRRFLSSQESWGPACKRAFSALTVRSKQMLQHHSLPPLPPSQSAPVCPSPAPSRPSRMSGPSRRKKAARCAGLPLPDELFCR